MPVTFRELRRLDQGQLLDVTMVERDLAFGQRFATEGQTFRLRFARLDSKMTSSPRKRIDNKRASPFTHIIAGEVVLEDLPSHVSIPPGLEPGQSDGTIVGIDASLIDNIAIVE